MTSESRKNYYSCPMHPEIRQDRSGMCPECGMALVRVKESLSLPESKHAGHSTVIFFYKFWINLALTIPVVVYSELPTRLFGWVAPAFPGSSYLGFILGSLIFFYGGWVFLTGAWREVRGRMPGMMTLIAIAISAAYSFSVFETFRGGTRTLFWELTTLITIMLLGHWIEMRAVQGAQGALRELSKLLPDTAEVIRGSELKVIPLAELAEGNMIIVRPGGKIPTDGLVIDGKSEVNESMITGESKPVSKHKDSEVIAGTINGDGSLTVRVTKIGEHTFLAGIMRLVREAQASKSRLQILSDRAAFWLTIVAVTTGGVTFFVWLLAKTGAMFATERLVAVLVVACPHALGLAVPLVASISTTLAARNGFLVRERIALEAARNVDIVLFDKTGTLTKGEYGVVTVFSDKTQGVNEEEVLRLAASVDAYSEHFIAKAIVRGAKERNIQISPVTDFVRIPGKGVGGIVNGTHVFVGGEAMLEERGVKIPEIILPKIRESSKKGQTIIYVFRVKEFIGAIALADIIRAESREAITLLKRSGVTVAMITGDSEDVARWIAEDLGINAYFAKVLPDQKADKVKLLQAQGKKVAMVGDGINDAPALTQADLGIAIGAGTNVAIESAGIILVRNDPRDIPKIIGLSRATYSKMVQNLFWAVGYNAVAIPLAAGVLATRGIILEPALAAVFMSVSTVIVAVNALLLRRGWLTPSHD